MKRSAGATSFGGPISFGLMALGVTLASPSTAEAQPAPEDTFACVRLEKRPQSEWIRFVNFEEPCGKREERMRVVVLATTPFVSHPEEQGKGAFVSTIWSAEAITQTSNRLLIDTTIVADAHSASSLDPEARPTRRVKCATGVDNFKARGAVKVPLFTSKGAPPGEDDDPERASLADVMRASLTRPRAKDPGSHTFETVCSGRRGVRFVGSLRLIVLE